MFTLFLASKALYWAGTQMVNKVAGPGSPKVHEGSQLELVLFSIHVQRNILMPETLQR